MKSIGLGPFFSVAQVILFLEAMGIEAAVQAARVEGNFFLEVLGV